MSNRKFALGHGFPREGFVQTALEKHFGDLGYQPLNHGYVDYAGVHPVSHDCWIVEAKGETSDVGLDFRTGLGQILQAMQRPSAHYGIAIPKTAQFSAQCRRMPEWVRTVLQLHWLVVDEAGTVVVVKPDEPLSEFGASHAPGRGGVTTGTLNDLVEICGKHVLDQSGDAIVFEPYVPFLPDRGHPGKWNRVLVLGEAQNLSTTYDRYVERLLNGSARDRILRLYWEPQIHVKPWDDGTLKLAMAAAFGCEAERFAVSNAVMWSTKKQEGSNETPGRSLQQNSARLWKEMLPLLDPSHVVTTGRVAGDLLASVRTDLGARWVHVQLASASPLYLARRAAKVIESELLRQYPRIDEVVRTHPEYVAKYRRNRIFFASEAVRAVEVSGGEDR